MIFWKKSRQIISRPKVLHKITPAKCFFENGGVLANSSVCKAGFTFFPSFVALVHKKRVFTRWIFSSLGAFSENVSNLIPPGLKYPPCHWRTFLWCCIRTRVGEGFQRAFRNKNLYLETNKYSSTPPFSKKPLAGAILQVTFGREIIWRDLFQKIIWRENFKKL